MLTLKNIVLKNLWKQKHSGKRAFAIAANVSEVSRKHATLFVCVLCHFLYTLEPAP